MSVSRVACEPWHTAPAGDVLALLNQEYTRWRVEFGWDLARDWAAVDPARRAGLVPGWIARDAHGAPRGWAFGVDQPGVRQIGALVADDEETAGQLIGAVLDRDAAGDTLLFVRSSPAISRDVLRARGFAVQSYRYLVAPTAVGRRRASGAGAVAGVEIAPWRSADLADTAALLADAYAADRSLRPFARAGTIDEWIDYVESLTLRPGCGVFSPAASATVRLDGRLVAVAMVTSIGPTTAHLVQLAVAACARGRGWSGQLVDRVKHDAARVLGASRCSLLVSAANHVACGLYERAGFRAAGEFVAASRHAAAAQPLRSISTAPATGGDSARR